MQLGLPLGWEGGAREDGDGVDQGDWRCLAGCLQVEAGLDVPWVVLAAVSLRSSCRCMFSFEENCLL